MSKNYLSQMDINSQNKYIKGKFLEEIPPRFLGKVEVEGEIEECYIACSSKLSNHIHLIDQNVLLKINDKKKARTKYTLQIVEKNETKIWVNLLEVNKFYAEELYRNHKFKDIKGEARIEGIKYRPDFIVDGNRIYEVKTLLTEDEKITFPIQESKRTMSQLIDMVTMLKRGYFVTLVLVILNPKIKGIVINQKIKGFEEALLNCIHLGMIIEIYKINPEAYFKLERNISMEKKLFCELDYKRE